MIQCQYQKTYTTKQRTFCLQIDTSFKTNALNALFGPSGAGKTSLLRTLSGLDSIDDGTIHFNDLIWVDSKTILPASQRNIAFVFQDYALFPNMTVLQNLQFAKNKLSESLLKEVVSILELSTLLNHKPNQLSGGQKQRVALARAILQEPDLLLLDEPLSSLDQELRNTILNYLTELPEKLGCTIIMVSHNLQDVLKVADHVVLLENGSVTRQGNSKILIPENTNNVLKGMVLKISEDLVSVLIGNQQIDVSLSQITTCNYKKGDWVEIKILPV